MKTNNTKNVLSLLLIPAAVLAHSASACEIKTRYLSCNLGNCAQIDVLCDGTLSARTTVASQDANRAEAKLRREWELGAPPASDASPVWTPSRPTPMGRVSNGGGFNAGYGPDATRPAQSSTQQTPFTLGPHGL